jgi:thiol-disulfide isomerase/thioredoxin
VVVVRFGHDWDPTCMQMDEILYKIADKVRERERVSGLPPQGVCPNYDQDLGPWRQTVVPFTEP